MRSNFIFVLTYYFFFHFRLDQCDSEVNKLAQSSKTLDYEIIELKEAQLDRKYEIETLTQDRKYDQELIRQEVQANAKSNLDSVTKLQIDLSNVIEQVQKLASLTEKIEPTETHVDFVHEELAKAIHIIDKHSVEIDELTLKLSYAGKNAKNDQENNGGCETSEVNDLRENLKTLQLHIASLIENVDKLNQMGEKLDAHDEQFDTFRTELDEVITAVVDADAGKG